MTFLGLFTSTPVAGLTKGKTFLALFSAGSFFFPFLFIFGVGLLVISFALWGFEKTKLQRGGNYNYG